MKSNKRATQKGSAKAAAQQGKITAGKVAAQQVARSGAGEGTDRFLLTVWDTSDGDLNDTGDGVTLSAAEYEAIKKDASARGETFNAWLVRTLDETPAFKSQKNKIAALDDQRRAEGEVKPELETPFYESPIDELSCAVDQSAALNQLLTHHVLNPGDSVYRGAVANGLLELGSQSRKRLAAAKKSLGQSKGGAL